MGLWSRLTSRTAGDPQPQEISEARPDLPNVERTGFEYGIPRGGTTDPQKARSHAAGRRQQTEEYYQAYLACPWVSTPIDTIARMCTAGGIELVPEDGDLEQTRPPIIQHYDRLLKFTNEREDMIQLARSTITDMLVFGDGFIEVGSVGGLPSALWTLDGTTMAVRSDEHGEVAGYVQERDGREAVPFDETEVIHIPLDAPRGGMYGVGPVQKLMVTITAWLFTQACLKEHARRGWPTKIAVDLSKGTSETEKERWEQQYQARHLGPRAAGMPIVTRVHPAGQAGAPPLHELQTTKVSELLETLNHLRDEMISGMGISPALVGVIESGNLGGGTGESQARNTHYNLIVATQNLFLEKLNYRLLTALGVQGWQFRFGEVDYRDSKTVEEIRDLRLRNGGYTLNDYLVELGKDPVPYGNEHVLVDRQNLVLWEQIPDLSQAKIDALNKTGTPAAEPGTTPSKGGGESPQQQETEPETPPAELGDAKESAPERHVRALSESWTRSYEGQRRRALRDLPQDR